MNYLLAKLKRNGGTLKIVSSETEILASPDLSSPKFYQASYKLEDDEWFYLGEFSQSDYSNDLIISDFNSTSYNQLVEADFDKIKYFWIKQGDKFYFQKIMPSQILKRKWLHISDEPSIQEDKKIIILNHWVDAVYVPNEDKLYFRDVSKIKAFFSGIDSIYREATQAEVSSFLQEDFISLAGDFCVDNVKVPNRKRIAIAMDTLRQFGEDDKAHIFQYIQNYCDDLSVSDDAFNIGNDEDLKKVLWGIEQRYYTTPLGAEKRLANSVIILD